MAVPPSFILKSYSGSAIPVDLSAPVTSSALTIPLNFASNPIASGWVEPEGTNAGSQIGTTGPFVIVLDYGQTSGGTALEEHVLCSGWSGNSALVYNSGGATGRGFDQTTAQAHAVPATASGLVFPILTGTDGYEQNQAVYYTIGLIAAKGDLLLGSAANANAKLGIGATSQVLNVAAGTGAWTYTYDLNPIAKLGIYTANNNDLVQMTGAHALTLPSPATSGLAVGMQQVTTAAATIVTPSGAIKGPGIAAYQASTGVAATTIPLATAGAFVVLVSDGTNWNIVGGAMDTGWLQADNQLINSWVVNTTHIYWRQIGNRVVWNGAIKSGTSNTLWINGNSTAANNPPAPGQAAFGIPLTASAANVPYAAQCNTALSGNGTWLASTILYGVASPNVGLDGLTYLVD